MVIYIDEKTTVKSQDMKEAAKKLDASDIPDGDYDFYYLDFKNKDHESITYKFNVKDGQVVKLDQ